MQPTLVVGWGAWMVHQYGGEDLCVVFCKSEYGTRVSNASAASSQLQDDSVASPLARQCGRDADVRPCFTCWIATDICWVDGPGLGCMSPPSMSNSKARKHMLNITSKTWCTSSDGADAWPWGMYTRQREDTRRSCLCIDE